MDAIAGILGMAAAACINIGGGVERPFFSEVGWVTANRK